jgi:hypothetical protein
MSLPADSASDLVEFGFGEFFFGIVRWLLRGIGHVILLCVRLAGFGRQSVRCWQRGNATRNLPRETAFWFGLELRPRRGIAGWQPVELWPRLGRTIAPACRRLRNLLMRRLLRSSGFDNTIDSAGDLVEFGFGEFVFGIVYRLRLCVGHVILLAVRFAGLVSKA